MSELLVQGLEISALGMGLTFASLGLLILTMVLLDRLFSPRPAPAEMETIEPDAAADVSAEEAEIAAAIGVALAYFRDQNRESASLGEALATCKGPWWSRSRSGGNGRPASTKSGWNN